MGNSNFEGGFLLIYKKIQNVYKKNRNCFLAGHYSPSLSNLVLALVSGLSAIKSQESLPSSSSQLELLSFQNKSTKVKPTLGCNSLLFFLFFYDLVPTLVY